MHAKFEVNSFRGWDFRQGVGVNLPPPPPCSNATMDTPMHNRVKMFGGNIR